MGLFHAWAMIHLIVEKNKLGRAKPLLALAGSRPNFSLTCISNATLLSLLIMIMPYFMKSQNLLAGTKQYS